jgi:polysaccharide export outer membrane protein
MPLAEMRVLSKDGLCSNATERQSGSRIVWRMGMKFFSQKTREPQAGCDHRWRGLPILSMLLTFTLMGTLPAQILKADTKSPADAHSQAVSAALPGPADTYLIGVDDVINVYILDVAELSREYRVSSAGTVTIPMLTGPLAAAGLTPTQFSESLAKELKSAGLVSDPHVSTSVDQSRLSAVAITGAVKRPQIYPLFSPTTLLDLLSQAEGLAEDAGNIAVVRRGEIAVHALGISSGAGFTREQLEGARTVTVDLKRLLDTGDSNLNVDVYPGDRVMVPHAGVIYVVGAVNKPGGFTMKPSSHGMTVLQALALAEDTRSTALKDQTVIIRNDAQSPGGRKQIPVELKKVLRGKTPDPVLQADDILFVPDSAGKRALHRSMEAIVQATTGIAIFTPRL